MRRAHWHAKACPSGEHLRLAVANLCSISLDAQDQVRLGAGAKTSVRGAGAPQRRAARTSQMDLLLRGEKNEHETARSTYDANSSLCGPIGGFNPSFR